MKKGKLEEFMMKKYLIGLLISAIMGSMLVPAAAFAMRAPVFGVTAYSAHSSFPPINARDNNIFNFYSSVARTGPNFTEWLQYDLGQKVYGVNRVRLYPREGAYGFPQDFKFQYSDSTSGPWTDASGSARTNFPSPGFKQVVIDFTSGVDARYVRLYATKLRADPFNNYYLQIAEMSIDQTISGNDQRVNVSSASASSQLSGMEKEKLWNNNTGNFYSSEVQAAETNVQSFTLNYDKRYIFTKLVLTPRSLGYGFPKRFRIQYSSDGTNFTTIPGQDYTGADYYTSTRPTTPQVFEFSSSVRAKYIRVEATKLGTDDYNNYYLQMAEATDYQGAPFSTDLGGDFDKHWNNLWMQFGSVDDGQDAVYKFGNEPTYFEWVARKMMWSNEAAYKSELKTKVRDFAQSSNGYIWSWVDNPRWPSGNSYHMTNNPLYILAAWRTIRLPRVPIR